jgi:hypothetical protein
MHARLRPVACAAVLSVVAGCGSNPAHPSSPANGGAAAALTGSVTTPLALQPAAGAVIKNVDQPVTLVVRNAVVTRPGDATYTFEIASDAAFATKVQTKSGVAAGTAGQTSVELDPLPAGAGYYWHARVESAGTTGVFSAAAKFTVGPAVVLAAPAPVSPLNGTQTVARPTFIVSNASRQGPAGAITYSFEIAANAAFSPVIAAGTVTEGTGQTSFTPAADLAPNQTYYWRATAADVANGVSSPASTAQTFTTSLAIDLSRVIISYPDAPSEIASWKETATIIAVEQDGNPATGGPMCISFSLSDDWPSVPFFGDPSVPVYANQWYFANIGGQWYAGPGEYLRADRSVTCKSGQGTNAIGPDGGWTGPMRTWVPRVGEMVGYMMSTPARNYSIHHTINERSNIVVQPWRDTSLGSAAVARTRP